MLTQANHPRGFAALLCAAASTIALVGALAAADAPETGPLQTVSAGGAEIVVPGYSVPSMGDFDGDGVADLIVGEGGGSGGAAQIRLYPNVGTAEAPAFSTFSYAQAVAGGGAESNLTVPAVGCLGLFPRLVNWNDDGLSDMLVGDSYGNLRVFLNIGTSAEPKFGQGSFVLAGPTDGKYLIDVGARATPSMIDWNDDGLDDLISGGYDGRVTVFLNEGTAAAPSFADGEYLFAGDEVLDVSTSRSSPAVVDFDGDGLDDLLTGETYGKVRFYRNIGAAGAPAFDTWSYVEADGVEIDLPNVSRSRPWVGDWNNDGAPDVLIGGSHDGGITSKVYVVEGVPEPASAALLAAAGVIAARRRRRA